MTFRCYVPHTPSDNHNTYRRRCRRFKKRLTIIYKSLWLLYLTFIDANTNDVEILWPRRVCVSLDRSVAGYMIRNDVGWSPGMVSQTHCDAQVDSVLLPLAGISLGVQEWIFHCLCSSCVTKNTLIAHACSYIKLLNVATALGKRLVLAGPLTGLTKRWHCELSRHV